MQRMGKCMQEKTLRTLYLHLVPLIDRYLVVKFKILSKTPRRSLFFPFFSLKEIGVSRPAVHHGRKSVFNKRCHSWSSTKQPTLCLP